MDFSVRTITNLAKPKRDKDLRQGGRTCAQSRLVSAETNGKKAPEEQIKKVRVVIRGSKHSVFFGDKTVAKEIAFQIDPTKQPKTVDDFLPGGQRILGIYELTGDTLRSCVAPAGKERPTRFAAEAGSGHTLRVFRRVSDDKAPK